MAPKLKRRTHDESSGLPSARRRRSESRSSVVSSTGDEPSRADNDFSAHDAAVKKLVRLALACEVSRKPVRRQDISIKVLEGVGGRNFKHVFDDANKKLRDVFGMLLVELPQKEKITIIQKRAAQRSGAAGMNGTADRSAPAANTKNYILTSVLAESYSNATILQPSSIPSAEIEAQYSGLCGFVVSTIMLSNNSRISEGKLHSYLQKARAEDSFHGQKTENIIKRMEREGYIQEVKDRDGGEEVVDYLVGPRGKTEIGRDGVAGIVKTVYHKHGSELTRLEDALERSLGEGAFRRSANHVDILDRDTTTNTDAQADDTSQDEVER